MIESLPLIRHLESDESFMGYVLRMSNTNGLNGIYWLYQQLGRDKLNRLKPEDILPIAQILGVSPSLMGPKFLSTHMVDGVRVIDVHGHRFTKPYLLKTLRPQLCPICIADRGYSKAVWDLTVVCACSEHQCLLIDACPHCLKPIQWMRPQIGSCNCGSRWNTSGVERLEVGDPCIQITNIVSQRLDVNNQACLYVSKLDDALSKLSLDAFSTVIWSFGIKPDANYIVSQGSSRTILRTSVVKEICRRAYARLSNLDDPMWCATIAKEVHLPSLHLLAKEATCLIDENFIYTLLKKLIPQSMARKNVDIGYSQLSLF